MAKVGYGKAQYKDEAGKLIETKTDRVYLENVSQEDFTKIAKDGGSKVYYEGLKKGISVNMEAGNEILSGAKGLKGKEFVDAIKSGAEAKYGPLGDKARVEFANTVYFKDGERKTTASPRIVLSNLDSEAFTKIAKDKGSDAYVPGIKSGIALSMESANEALQGAKGTKGKDFYVALENFVTEKYGVDFTPRAKEVEQNEVQDYETPEADAPEVSNDEIPGFEDR